MELFLQDHPGVAHVEDIKHQTACLLKHRLEADLRGARFITQSNQTKLRVTQTSLASLHPPALKTKARYLNLDRLVRWVLGALAFLDNPRHVCGPAVDGQVLEEKLGWLREYRPALEEWSEWLALTIDSATRSGELER